MNFHPCALYNRVLAFIENQEIIWRLPFTSSPYGTHRPTWRQSLGPGVPPPQNSGPGLTLGTHYRIINPILFTIYPFPTKVCKSLIFGWFLQLVLTNHTPKGNQKYCFLHNLMLASKNETGREEPGCIESNTFNHIRSAVIFSPTLSSLIVLLWHFLSKRGETNWDGAKQPVFLLSLSPVPENLARFGHLHNHYQPTESEAGMQDKAFLLYPPRILISSQYIEG